MGLMVLAGALQGAGQAGQASLYGLQQALSAEQLQERREQFENARQDKTIAAQKSLQESGQTFQAGQAKEERGFKTGERQDVFAQSIILNRQRMDFDKEMQQGQFGNAEKLHRLDHEYAKELAIISMGAQASRSGEEIRSREKIAYAELDARKNDVTIVPSSDGRYIKMTKDGRPRGLVMDPDDPKKPLQGPKDLDAGRKVLAEVMLARVKGNEALMRSGAFSLMLPDQQEQVRRETEELQNDVAKLVGQKLPEKAKKAAIVDPFAQNQPALTP